MSPAIQTNRSDTTMPELFANSPVPMWIYDLATLCFIEVNEAAVRHYGYTREHFLAMTLLDIRDEDEQRRVQDYVQRMGPNTGAAGIWRHLNASGGAIWAEVTLQRIVFAGRDAMLAIAVDVTARIEAQTESDRLFAFSGDMLTVASIDGTILRVNPAMTDTLGFEPDDLAGRNLFEFLHPDDHALATEELVRLAQTGGSVRIETRCRHKDGSWRWIAWTTRAVGGCIYSTGRDATERRRRDREQFIRERQLIEAQRIAHLGHWHLTLGTKQAVWSEETYRLFGVEPDRFVPVLDAIAKLVHPDDRDHMSEMLARTIADGSVVGTEYRAVLPSGDVRHHRTNAVCERDASGAVIAVFGIIQDVTERKRAEAELKRSHQLLEVVFDQSDDPMFVKDREGRFVLLNKACADVLGCTVTDAIGRRASEFFPADVADGVESVDIRVIGSRGVEVSEERVPNGADVRFFQTRKFPWRSQSGEVLGVVGIARDITELKRKEGELKAAKTAAEAAHASIAEAQIQLRQIANTIPGAVYQFTVDDDGSMRFPFMSDGLKDLYGLDPADAISNPSGMFGSVLPEDIDRLVASITRVVEQKTAWFCEYRIRVDGRVKWIRAESTPEPRPDGGFVWNGVLIDVTEQKQAEAALRERDERFQLVAKATNDAIWDWDVARDDVFWSDAVEPLFGYRPDLVDARPKWWMDRIHPDDRGRVVGGILDVIRDGAVWCAEYRFRRADGSYAHVLDRGFMTRDTEGNPLRMLGSMMDISDRKRAEEKVRESERRVRELLQALPAAIYTTDAEGRIQFYNEVAVELWGRRPQVGHDRWNGAWRLYTADGAPLPHAKDPMAVALKEGRPTRGKEFAAERFDGSRVQVMPYPTPLRDASGAVVGGVNMLVDITHLKQAEAELVVAKDAAEAANAAKSEFLACMSHELRTPLNAIIGFSEVMTTEMFGSLGHPKYLAYAHDIHWSGSQLLNLINGVLDLARIEAGQVGIEPDCMALEPVLRDKARLFAPQLDKAGLVLEVAPQANNLAVMVDPQHLRQMLINLIGNAMKFTPRGGRIYLSAARDGETVTISVRDTGVGIPPERLADVTKPFVHVEHVLSKQHGGAGIGLYVTKSLAEANGGRLELASAPGEGTTATLVLRAVRQDGESGQVTPRYSGHPLPTDQAIRTL